MRYQTWNTVQSWLEGYSHLKYIHENKRGLQINNLSTNFEKLAKKSN